MGCRWRKLVGGRHAGEGGRDGCCARRGEVLVVSRAGGSNSGSRGRRSVGDQRRVGKGASSQHMLRAKLSLVGRFNGYAGVLRLVLRLCQSCGWTMR